MLVASSETLIVETVVGCVEADEIADSAATFLASELVTVAEEASSHGTAVIYV